jgi:hypothetical protein
MAAPFEEWAVEYAAYLVAEGWVEDCGGKWNGPGMGAGTWVRFFEAILIQAQWELARGQGTFS